MRRKLVISLLLAASTAHADAELVAGTEDAPDQDEIGDQAIGAEVGVAGGGNVTPGGLRIAGHYLYQMSQTDWFDGTASFTHGGGDAQCFRDRMDTFQCGHGFTDGSSF